MAEVDAMTEPAAAGTRERLLFQGLRLFAERGYDAVTVGEIERAAGLVPRRGALYRHFPSKDALLDAAVRDYLASVIGMRARYSTPTPGDLHGAALALARQLLLDLDRLRDITRVLERDGHRLPGLRDRFRHEVVDHAVAAMTELVTGWWRVATTTEPPDDLTAWATHLLGGLVNARRSAWTFGHSPGDLDDDHLARSWANMCVHLISGTGRNR